MSVESGPTTFPSATPRLRARLKQLNASRLGEALSARSGARGGDRAAEGVQPAARGISPELVLVDPALAAWARERC